MAETSFARPDLATLKQRAEAAINAMLPGADARLRRNVLNVLAAVVSGQTHGLYGYLDFIATTALPSTAQGEYLMAWGRIWGVLPKAASNAVGAVDFAGTNGAAIPQGTTLRRADGVLYATAVGATIADGVANVAVEAVEAGEDGNAAAATVVSLVSPLAGITTAAAVDSGGLAGGADVEGDEAYRLRILARIQEPPHGGADADYPRWALEVPGVTRAWVYPQELGPGTVTVRFAMDATYENGIPEAGDVAAVQAHIDSVRPVTAEVFVVAPEPAALNITIASLTPDTPEIRAAISAELADMFKRKGVPAGTIRLSQIWEAVSIAAGEDSHRITSPTTDTTFGTNELPVLGTVTYA